MRRSVDKRSDLAGKIAEIIRDTIILQKLGPGDRLPAERSLADSLHVSRLTVREAIKIIEQWGMVQIRRGAGIFVREPSESTVCDSIERFFNFRNCTHLDMIHLRELIEPDIAAHAARNATEEDLIRLKVWVEKMEEDPASGDRKESAEADLSFHEYLARMCGNPLLLAIAVSLHNLMGIYLESQHQYLMGEATRSHRLIFEAIAAGNARQAKKLMRYHIKLASQTYLEMERKKRISWSRS